MVNPLMLHGSKHIALLGTDQGITVGTDEAWALIEWRGPEC